jgi:hypothetical protein
MKQPYLPPLIRGDLTTFNAYLLIFASNPAKNVFREI